MINPKCRVKGHKATFGRLARMSAKRPKADSIVVAA
jgi:hypothetical protein